MRGEYHQSIARDCASHALCVHAAVDDTGQQQVQPRVNFLQHFGRHILEADALSGPTNVREETNERPITED
jgi:hypothetical protein